MVLRLSDVARVEKLRVDRDRGYFVGDNPAMRAGGPFARVTPSARTACRIRCSSLQRRCPQASRSI